MAEASAEPKGEFASLERGYELSPFKLRISAQDVAGYLDATGEQHQLWERCVPPLALGAFALGGLMDRFQVPAGLVHTGQEYDFTEAVSIDEPVEVRITVTSNSERRGARMVVFATELLAGARPVGRGRTTVMLALEGEHVDLASA